MRHRKGQQAGPGTWDKRKVLGSRGAGSNGHRHQVGRRDGDDF